MAAQRQQKKRTNDVLQTADIFTRYGQGATTPGATTPVSDFLDSSRVRSLRWGFTLIFLNGLITFVVLKMSVLRDPTHADPERVFKADACLVSCNNNGSPDD